MQTTSETHRAEVSDGILRVHALTPPQLAVTTAQGTTIQPLPPLLRPIAERPVFAATYVGDRYAEVDLCAGFQRWHGSKSLQTVRKALGRCGFDRSTTDSLLRDMKREQADCPYYYR
jgi:hypothetical protein